MVLELEVASFELASLELAGGLYANDCALTATGIGLFSPGGAKVREASANASGYALLVLDGQMAGTLQADMNCAGSSNVVATLQAIGASVTTSHSQSITSLSLQASGATVAQSVGMSAATYAAGSYAAAAHQASGQSAPSLVGQSIFQSNGTLTGTSIASASGQAVYLSRLSGQNGSNTLLQANAYGDQRLSALGLSVSSLKAARVREGQHAIFGAAAGNWNIGAFATTELGDAVGDFEIADFELSMGELGGEAIRYGAAHAEMLCVGQCVAKSDFQSVATTLTLIYPAYALQSSYVMGGASETDWQFSVYKDAFTTVNGASVAQYTVPNARLFRLLPHAYDTSARAYEIRGTLRPFEGRSVKRPWEPRDIDLSTQPRTVSWS